MVLIFDKFFRIVSLSRAGEMLRVPDGFSNLTGHNSTEIHGLVFVLGQKLI